VHRLRLAQRLVERRDDAPGVAREAIADRARDAVDRACGVDERALRLGVEDERADVAEGVAASRRARS